MKKLSLHLLCILCLVGTPLFGIPRSCPADDCDPCAAACGTSCGLSACSVVAAIGAVVAVAAIIIATSDGDSDVHSHNP